MELKLEVGMLLTLPDSSFSALYCLASRIKKAVSEKLAISWMSIGESGGDLKTDGPNTKVKFFSSIMFFGSEATLSKKSTK